MRDLIIVGLLFYIIFGLFFGLWYSLEIADNNRKANWKAFPIYFLLGAPGIIFFVIVMAIDVPIDWIITNFPKQLGPFK